jgi:hypothetical protein
LAIFASLKSKKKPRCLAGLGDNTSCCPDSVSFERDYLDIELSDMVRWLFSHKLGELFGSSLRDQVFRGYSERD